MRFFEVDSAVDAIMSAAMLAQTKAGSRSQQGQLSMNGFLQMLKNAGIMMDYEGFKTVYDTNPQLANVIEKFDKDTVTFMSADGDNKAIDNTKQTNQPSPDERITQMARSAVRTREAHCARPGCAAGEGRLRAGECQGRARRAGRV